MLSKRFSKIYKSVTNGFRRGSKLCLKVYEFQLASRWLPNGLQRMSKWLPKQSQESMKLELPKAQENGFTPQSQIYEIQISGFCFQLRLTLPAKTADPIRFYGAISPETFPRINPQIDKLRLIRSKHKRFGKIFTTLIQWTNKKIGSRNWISIDWSFRNHTRCSSGVILIP